MKNGVIRNAVKAIIIQNNCILLIKHHKDETYYTLPGGGQRHNEEIRVALKRECYEELGVDIVIKDIIFVTEYMADKHNQSIQKKGFHQIDMFFECELIGSVNIDSATEIDKTQVGYDWISIDKLKNIVMYPEGLKDRIKSFTAKKKGEIYIGEVQ